MNVASLSLCKELYELSGWDETGHEYSLYDGSVIKVEGPSTSSPKFVTAYDLGYLLRKLPPHTEIYKNGRDYTVGFTGDTKDDDRLFIRTGPEDAACKLAIELIKQKVITV